MRIRTLSAAGVVLAALALPAGAAAAQTAETGAIQATFRGNAPAGCLMSSPSAPTSENVSVGALSPGSADIAISQMVGDDATALGATIVLVLPAVCNQAHTLNLSSLNGGLLGDGEAPISGAFRSLVPYSVTVNWAGGEQVLLTSDQELSVPFGDAAAGVVTVTIQIPPGGAPLVAGAYTDEIVLELGAAG
jgi:hypothetical protein